MLVCVPLHIPSTQPSHLIHKKKKSEDFMHPYIHTTALLGMCIRRHPRRLVQHLGDANRATCHPAIFSNPNSQSHADFLA